MSELANCPFCGQKLIKNGPFSRRNADCYVHPQDVGGLDVGRCPASGFRLYSNDAERIELWNRRAPPEPSAAVARLRELSNSLQALSAGFALGAVYGEFPHPEATLAGDIRALLPSGMDRCEFCDAPFPSEVGRSLCEFCSDSAPAKPASGPVGELEEHKALLSMLVTLERALSNSKPGEEMEALCAEARALITAETHRMPRPNPPARES